MCLNFCFFNKNACLSFADMKSKFIYSIMVSMQNAYSIVFDATGLMQIKQYINTQYNEKLNQNSELTLFSPFCC